MIDLFDLKDKVAIITGGNGGIGKGIAEGFAEAGSNIIIAARNRSKNEKAVNEITGKFGVKALGIQADILEEDQIKVIVEKTLDEFGKLNILVNNAGINIRKLPQDLSANDWDQVLDVNLRGAFLCSKLVYPAMKRAGSGKIINIGSMTSLFAGAKLAPYGASKGGIVQLTRSLAVAWAKDNIQVNAILPGFINTELTIKARKEIEGMNEKVLARTPAGRWGDPEDLKGTAIFLASSASDFVTGIALPVDGGFSSVMV
jgi:2-deoxy-D-gluconate 3-dehydrogenase